MIDCDERPGHPPDGTVRADRRSRHRSRPAAAGTSQEAVRCRAGVPGGSPGLLLGARSERHWLRLCRGRLGHLFPYLPHHSGYCKRVKAAAPLICQTMQYLVSLCPSQGDQLRLLDATPVPCGTSRETVRCSELGGLRVLCRALAVVLGAEAVPARHTGGPAGRVVPGRPEDRRARRRRRPAGPCPRPGHAARQDDRPGRQGPGRAADRTLRRRPGPGAPGPARPHRRQSAASGTSPGCASGSRRSSTPSRTSSASNGTAAAPAGVYARVAQRLLALAAVIWLNWRTGTSEKRSLIAYDH